MIYLIISVLMFRLTSLELSVYVCLISLNCLVSSHDLCLGNDVYRILELSKVLHCKNWLQMKMKLWLHFSIKCGSFICMMISFFQTMKTIQAVILSFHLLFLSVYLWCSLVMQL